MKDVEKRRVVPIATITLVCAVFLGLFQVFVLTGSYQVKASTVRKTVPFLYEPYRKMMGEHPSYRTELVTNAKKKESSTVATVAGIDPSELQVTIESPELPPLKVEPPKKVAPAPEKNIEPVDENIPVG